jgi:hypothetical protein
MTDPKNLIAFHMPADLAQAVAAAAEQDMISVSAICRQALAKEMRQRGFYRSAARAGNAS